MLTSLILQFTSPERLELPRDLGRASHSLLLRTIAASNSEVSKQMHESSTTRPFTCSNVFGAHRKGDTLVVTPEDALWLRYTGLSDDVSTVLKAMAASPPAEIELEQKSFRVTGATLDPAVHPLARSTSYAEFAAPHLLAKQMPSPRITLRFTSPTAFRAKGQNLPLPLPGSVFGSLADKWNAFAPITLPDEVRRFGEECMAISQFKGRTRMLHGKSGSTQIGFIGAVRFTAINRDRYWISVMNLLAEFALFAGVGYQTTQGMGQCRRLIEDDAPQRNPVSPGAKPDAAHGAAVARSAEQ